MDFLGLVKSIVGFNCDILRVPAPAVQIVEPSMFASPTMLAAASSTGTKMFINSDFAAKQLDLPFLWLTVSHECRHVWQAFRADLFKDYRTRSDQSIAEYNAQPAEVDAWAWAVLVVSEKFGIRPTLERQLGAEVWKMINSRARQIAEEGRYW